MFSYDDPFLAGYNSNGDILWAKHGGDGWDDKGYDMTVDDSNNIYITGANV